MIRVITFLMVVSSLAGCVPDIRHAYMQDWTVQSANTCPGTHTDATHTTDIHLDLLAKFDVIKPTKFWIWRSVKAERGGETIFKLRKILRDKKTIFGVHTDPVAGHHHCVAIDYIGKVRPFGESTDFHSVMVHSRELPNDDTACNAQFLNPATNITAGCGSSHQGVWEAW
jgi:hypothetical protein